MAPNLGGSGDDQNTPLVPYQWSSVCGVSSDIFFSQVSSSLTSWWMKIKLECSEEMWCNVMKWSSPNYCALRLSSTVSTPRTHPRRNLVSVIVPTLPNPHWCKFFGQAQSAPLYHGLRPELQLQVACQTREHHRVWHVGHDRPVPDGDRGELADSAALQDTVLQSLGSGRHATHPSPWDLGGGMDPGLHSDGVLQHLWRHWHVSSWA